MCSPSRACTFAVAQAAEAVDGRSESNGAAGPVAHAAPAGRKDAPLAVDVALIGGGTFETATAMPLLYESRAGGAIGGVPLIVVEAEERLAAHGWQRD